MSEVLGLFAGEIYKSLREEKKASVYDFNGREVMMVAEESKYGEDRH